ncbi:MAG: nucleotide exchange factor GrpE [archaeon]
MKELEKEVASGGGPEGGPEGGPGGEPCECTCKGNKEPEESGAKVTLQSKEEVGKELRLLRLAADFENYKKRTAKEFADQRNSGKKDLLEKLISLSDTFELALHSVKNASPEVLKGFLMIQNQLKAILSGEGAEPFGTSGEHFDPFRHEAVEFVASAGGAEEGTVSEVIQKGYLFKGNLLRPCAVKVFKNATHQTGDVKEDAAPTSEPEMKQME